ncbi:MAG: lipoate--protein ligase family protein [Candidatus Diapherotrites archaeon]|uniref:Lipoate--protein ligase family protein n=1 Tax=Candidatus Iainarchaeum sp. TaxID=3101447 RepID=A0A938YQQ5_9ARCH|nr:lipoate--protein ligase family protein [Candidatus Diapherotrites archaeon]
MVGKPMDAFTNMAIDKAVLFSRPKPTVRLYQWKPAAVSIGCFQGLEQEVDLNACSKHGIDVVRRITGGGAVFHDKEITYSIVLDEESGVVPSALKESYGKICGAVIRGLAFLGVDAAYVPLNDLVANGRKISGCAQTRREKGILQHGTVLMQVDVEKMFSVLKVPDEKIRGKMIASVKDRVTSLERELGRPVSAGKVMSALKKGFESEFGVKLVKGCLTSGEKALAAEFREDFASRGWNRCR